MPTPTFRPMSPAGYFGTGVALGVLIGVFVGFIAHGIMREDTPAETSSSAREIDTTMDRFADPDALDAAPAAWGDAAPDHAPTPDDASPETAPPGDDPFVHGQQDLPAWPRPDEDRHAPALEEDTPDDGPTPGGARLPDDPSRSFDAPED